jgi:hypothetical protein
MKTIQQILDEQRHADIYKKSAQQIAVVAHNTGRTYTEEQRRQIAESNRKHKEENPLTAKQKKQIGDAMRGKTLEELVGEEAAARGRKSRSEASKGKKRPAEVGEKIAATRRARGSYDGRCMRGKEHKESTKEMMAVKAQIRQDLRRKLNLGKAGKLSKELLLAEYKRAGL